MKGFCPGGHSMYQRAMVAVAVRAHLDSYLDLLGVMPALRGESRRWPVVTSVSRLLRSYPDESV